MGDMKKLMENWRSYEKEVLQEYFLLPALAMQSGDHEVETPEGRQAMVDDAKKGYDSEMNYMVKPQDREDFQMYLDNNATDDELFRSTKGQMGTGTDMTRKDMEEMLRARWSDIAFDPSDPLDYASAGMYMVPVAGQFAKVVVGANKARKLHNKYKTFQTLKKAIPLATKGAHAIEVGQLGHLGGTLAVGAYDKVTGAKEKRDEEDLARWHAEYSGTKYDPEHRSDILGLDQEVPEVDEEESEAIPILEAPAAKAGILSKIPGRKPKKTPSGGTTKASDGQTVKIKGLEGVDEATDAGRAAMRQYTKFDEDAQMAAVDSLPRRIERAEKLHKINNPTGTFDLESATKEAEAAARADYLKVREDLADWTSGYHSKYKSGGKATADKAFGLTGTDTEIAARMFNPEDSSAWRAAKGMDPSFTDKLPAVGDMIPNVVKDNPIMRNPKKSAGAAAATTATVYVGKKAIDLHQRSAALEDEPSNVEPDPAPVLDQDGNPVVKPELSHTSDVDTLTPAPAASPPFKTKMDDGEEFKQESIDRSKRVGKIIREEVLRYLYNRREK